MKEEKPIEVTNKTQRRRRQEPRVEIRVRISQSKDYRSSRNTFWKLGELMPEYESIEFQNLRRQSRQESKAESRIQT
jgi:hypothetical protein